MRKAVSPTGRPPLILVEYCKCFNVFTEKNSDCFLEENNHVGWS